MDFRLKGTRRIVDLFYLYAAKFESGAMRFGGGGGGNRPGAGTLSKQEDLSDLITALLKFNCSLSTTVVAQGRLQF